jgi:L-ascorbate metabolism protein UlaG (beta-lactamase superfamily)
MQIHYFGLSSFKIITKEATIITDPFDKKSGLTPPRGNADILILSDKNDPMYTAISGISGEPFLINDPGEYDTKGVTVTGLPVKQDNGFVTVFLIESEDIKILNLAHIKDFSLKEDELEALGQIDILIIPVGGGEVMDASTASKIVNDIEPKIVIPSQYQKLDSFVKEMGGKSEELDKLILKKKDLAEEGIKLVALTPLR